MPYRLKNLSNIPFDVPTLAGPAILPALGDLADIELDALTAEVMRQSPYVEIVDESAAADPLDHDGDGRKGGSKPAADRDIDDLRQQYEELFGEAPDKRWGAPRLQTAIDEKLAS